MRTALSRSSRKYLAISFLKYMVTRNFAGVHVMADPKIYETKLPTIYYANHSSLWDFAICTCISYSKMRQDPFTMTAEYTMLPLAEWAGSFGVNHSDAFGVAKTLRYAQNLLKHLENPALWVFPQGLIYPMFKRPLDFKEGIKHIINGISEVNVVPVSISYVFGNHTKPEAFLCFGSPHTSEELLLSKDILELLENRMVHQLNHMMSQICNGETQDYETVIQGNKDLRYFVLRLRGRPYPPLKIWGKWHEK